MSQATTYSYDAAGRLRFMTDANTHQIEFEYDTTVGRLRYKYWPDRSYEEYHYDPMGSVTWHRLADGTINQFAYDTMNRLQTAQYAGQPDITYTYTDSGQVETVNDARGAVNYGYDDLDRPTSASYGGQSVSYAYDAAGNRTSMTTPAGTISYQYDDVNRLAQVLAPGGTTNYTYDAAGLLVQAALPNGVTTAYGYDGAYRPTSIVHNNVVETLDSYTYTYDAAGNRKQVTEHDGTSMVWTYDNAYRLLSETRNGGATSYTYDAVGNRLTTTQNSVTTYSVYNTLDQLLCTRSTMGDNCTADVLASYVYDGRGNLIQESDSANSTTYTFDTRDLLTGVTSGSTTIAYTYDAGGRRISENLNGTLTHYRWDEFSPYEDIVVETDASGAIRPLLGNRRLISQTRGGTATI
jgi:YD repeat-containing protein